MKTFGRPPPPVRDGGSTLALLFVALAMMVGPVGAQQAAPLPVPDLTQPVLAPEWMSVGQRPTPEYAPVSIRAGSFTIQPTLDIGERFNSNIYGSYAHPVSDFITFVRPTVDVRSDWGGDSAVGLYVTGDIDKYARHTTENVNNMIVEADGRLGILEGEYVELRAGYQIQHESRYAADSVAAVQYADGGYYARYPTEFSVAQAIASYVHSRGLIGFAVDVELQSYDFKNEPTVNGGLALNSDRNRNVYSITPRVSYELAPGYHAFIQTSVTRNQYDSDGEATPEHLNRRSTSFAVAAGSQFDLGDVLVGEFYLGYSENRYEDSRLSTLKGPYFAGSLLWNVTRQTSVTSKLTRWVDETILIGSPGIWQTQVKGIIERELRRPVLLTADVSYLNSDFVDVARHDNLLSITGGLKWKFNRLLSWNVLGGWQQRWSTQSINDLREFIASVNLKLAF